MRSLALATVLLASLPIFAIRPRPVSNLRLETEAALSTRANSAASDGTDFLVVGTSSANFTSYVAVQKLSRRKVAGSWHLLADGVGQGIAWTGTQYLVAWTNQQGLWVAEVSRHGAALRMPDEPVMAGGLFAANGTAALVFGRATSGGYVAQPLDSSGRKAGDPRIVSAPSGALVSLSAAADGFIAIIWTARSVDALVLGRDGTLRADVSLPPGIGYATATDGRDTAIFFSRSGSIAPTRSEMWSVILAADGSIRRSPFALGRSDPSSLLPDGAVWDGSQYLVASSMEYGRKTSLLRASRDGVAIGELIDLETAGSVFAFALNDRELLVTTDGGATFISRETLQPSPAVRLWQTPAPQLTTTVAEGTGGYLAAWQETAGSRSVIRASRVDATGHHLDGEGVVLGDGPATFLPIISAAGFGSGWIVVWNQVRAAREFIVAARLSPDGTVLDSPPLVIGPGSHADVRWNGTQYVIVHGTRSLLESTCVTRDGRVSPTTTLAEGPFERSEETETSIATYFLVPSLEIIGNDGLVVWQRYRDICHEFGAGAHCVSEREARVEAVHIDRHGMALGAPFTIALEPRGKIAVATDGTRYLVAWGQENGLFGTFVPAGLRPESGELFRIAPGGLDPSFAFDGADYVGAWQTWPDETTNIFTARISRSGTVSEVQELQRDRYETATGPAVAASAKLPPLIAFISRHHASGLSRRGAMLFASEFEIAAARPSTPVLTAASRVDDDAVVVEWQPAFDAFGISIELQSADGSYHEIGVASATAAGARVSLAGETGTHVRLRTWSSAGESDPSNAIALSSSKRRAAH